MWSRWGREGSKLKGMYLSILLGKERKNGQPSFSPWPLRSRVQCSRSSNYSLKLGLSSQLDSGVWPFQICQEPSSIKRHGTKTNLSQTAKLRESILWLINSPFLSHFLLFFPLLLSKLLVRDLADIDSWSPSTVCFLSGNCFLSSLSKLWHKIYIFFPMEELSDTRLQEMWGELPNRGREGYRLSIKLLQ